MMIVKIVCYILYAIVFLYGLEFASNKLVELKRISLMLDKVLCSIEIRFKLDISMCFHPLAGSTTVSNGYGGR